MTSVPENTHHVTTETTTAQHLWRTAVAYAAAKARQALPEVGTRLDRALELVFSDAVELHDDGTARVTSRTATGTTYEIANGTCTCKDHPHAPDGWCLHRLARALTVKAIQIARELSTTTAPAVISQPGIPAQFLVEIQGATAIRWGGLLHLAHERGLESLRVEVVSVSAELAVMQATAIFANGQHWTDIGDASPANVGPRIAPHFIRMASTRAMARCLRLALDVPYVCAVELADE